jgi:menaquinone-specific isochorismate synthase
VTQPGASRYARPSLVARSQPLDPTDFDLLDHLGPEGFVWFDGPVGFVTSGVAMTVDADEAPDIVRTLAHESTAGVSPDAGPRAVGALPFAGSGRMVVPARLTGLDHEGRAWMTTFDGCDAPPSLRVANRTPTRFEVAPRSDTNSWNAAVDSVRELIDRGVLAKVVLAREVTVEADEPFDVRAVVWILRRSQPGCVVYADSGFVGASPELLVRRRGRRVISRPLAGTADSIARLVASTKDAREHAYVVEAVVRTLTHLCDDIRADGPTALAFGDITHFATTVSATVRDERSTALDLARALHPTPAVAGTPTNQALAMIRRLEPTSRGRYAGPCGWIDGRGDGDFVVALRCAEIAGTRARLHAGAGIVAGSDARAEWSETQAKFEPMLRALVRP